MALWKRSFTITRKRQDLQNEISAHLAIEMQQRIDRGESADEARRNALRDFGNVDLAVAVTRDTWGGVWREQLLQDLRFASRTLAKAPAFTVIAILTVALGVGANTAVFSVINTVLLKPLGYRDSGNIVMFQNVFPRGRFGSTSPTEFNWWRQQTQAFQDISAYEFEIGNLTSGSFPEQIPIMHVSADFFRLFGAHAVHGRTFAATDDLPNAPKTVVLAYGFWQRRFASDPNVIGTLIHLNGESYEIIGVVELGLQSGHIAEQSMISGDIHVHDVPDIYLPFQLDPNSAEHGHYFNVAGRLKAGISLAAANTQLQSSYTEFARKWPAIDVPGRGFGVQPLQTAIAGGLRNSLLILFGAVSLVLLLACANVANLLVARASGRKREIAIRSTMGAGTARIVRQLLTESVMLSMAGGVLGLAAGCAGIRAILYRLPNNVPRIGPAGANVTLDWRVLAFTLCLSFLTGILFGLVPAFQSSRADLSVTLKESSNRTGTALRLNRTRELLVAIEMMQAVVLLIGAALLMRSFIAIRHVDPGFDAQNVLTTRVSLTGPGFANAADVMQTIRQGLQRIASLPGVEAAAATCCVPLEDQFQGAFKIAGRPEGPDSGGPTGTNFVSAGYFDVFTIPIVRGRAFTEADENGSPSVIINETLAKRFWPDSEPLNEYIMIAGGPRRIIGIAGDVHDAFLNQEPRVNVYLPLSAGAGGLEDSWAFAIRSRGNPISLKSSIEKELREATGGLPVGRFRTMAETISRSTAAADFSTLVLVIFGFAALLLAALGVYGVMAYSVAQRAQEVGIRLALGAESSQIQKMMILHSLRPALAGVVCGLAAALGLTRLIAAFLFGVSARDPLAFSVAPIMLLGVTLAAVWLPAMRVSHVDPCQVLRHE